jgi:ABC-type bacteriocin/lantibiotic exporter with double-glycine peptidase domain
MATAIPLLAAIALGLQRLLPAAQLMFGSWSTIHGAQASLQDVLDMLELPVPPQSSGQVKTQPIDFQHEIRFRAVSFRHKADAPWLFDRIDLAIPKGARVGFVGVTGSGKSTLLDIAMGLLQPVSGRIEIDGIEIDARNRAAWQKHIAHVPQSVFLADCSLEENIAFGVPIAKIDRERVRRAAKQAQLAELVEAWPLAYDTRVGERGVQLSGGQRQRIGIARALYKNADVIVFDEATSALDNDTERSVMTAIDGLSGNITVLIIAHRLNTLNSCTHIVEVGHGTVKRRDSVVDISGAEVQ